MEKAEVRNEIDEAFEDLAELVSAKPAWRKYLLSSVVLLFILAAGLTGMTLWYSLFEADQTTAERLSQAGDFASGTATALAFIAAVVALLLTLKNDDQTRAIERELVRRQLRLETSVTYDQAANEAAVQAVIKLRALAEALQNIINMAVGELALAARQLPIDSEHRYQTAYAMQSFRESVTEARSCGALAALHARRVVFRLKSDEDQSIDSSVGYLVESLAAMAWHDTECSVTSLGMKWLSTEHLRLAIERGGDPSAAFVTDAGEVVSQVEFTVSQLAMVTVSDLRAYWSRNIGSRSEGS